MTEPLVLDSIVGASQTSSAVVITQLSYSQAHWPHLSKRLTRNPRVATLQVPHPGLEDRRAYLLRLLDKQSPSTLETLARVTAGLQLRQVKDVVSPLDFGPAENQTAQASALETALMRIRLRKKKSWNKSVLVSSRSLSPNMVSKPSAVTKA